MLCSSLHDIDLGLCGQACLCSSVIDLCFGALGQYANSLVIKPRVGVLTDDDFLTRLGLEDDPPGAELDGVRDCVGQDVVEDFIVCGQA